VELVCVEMNSRMSSCSELSDFRMSGSTTSDSTCKEIIHSLYQELEPQLSKSYRPHVTFVPPPKPERELERRKLKTASLVIGALAEMKKRQSLRKKTDPERRESNSRSDKGFGKGKDVAKSWPNLTGSAS